MRSRSAPPLARASSALACILIAGCAAQGPFPSLAPRAVEFQNADAAPEPAPIVPRDPATAARIEALAEQAHAGDAAFEAGILTARRLAARAGTSGSESWIAAQQALSRAQSARGATVDALAEIDRLTIALTAARPPASPLDIAAALAALEAVEGLAARQHSAIQEVQSAISSR